MSEQISALIDSELDEPESSRLIDNLKQDAALRQDWAIYHQIGDALRRTPQFSTAFMARLSQQLDAEPTVLAPRKRQSIMAPAPYAMPIAASIAAFGLVGVLSWKMLPWQEAGAPAVSIASSTASSTKAVIDAKGQKVALVHFSQAIPSTYLLAHQEFSPSYTVEGMPAYIRTVSEQR